MKTLKFLTSNPQKASDFSLYGVQIEKFPFDVPEIKDPDVSKVALYKAKYTGLDDIVVEDTALYIDGCPTDGTDIKHIYEEIKRNNLYGGKPARWRVSLCAKTEGRYLISTGSIPGKILTPFATTGYHFEKFFAVPLNGVYVHYALLNQQTKNALNPRFKAMEGLLLALQKQDYSKVCIFQEHEVKNWAGLYQNSTINNTVQSNIKYKNNRNYLLQASFVA